MDTSLDTRMMTRALQLARRGRYWARPNPHVGCVLVREGKIIGEGFTQPAGGNHAEIEALTQAGDARGATAYLTLEPCSHHGRTGPCADALIAAGVSRVVAAIEDPNPKVAGSGLALCKAGEIEVTCGLLAAEATALIPGFIARMSRGRGRVRVKLAMSLDGRTAMASGESKWITGAAARRDVQRLRAESCAIVTGVGTVLSDDCALTVRHDEVLLNDPHAAYAPPQPPLRVVLDSSLRTTQGARILSPDAPTLLLHGEGAVVPEYLKVGKAALDSLPRGSAGLDLVALMELLAERQCNEILVESGPRLAGALLQAGLLDELIVYMAPTLMGDKAQPLLELPIDTMGEKVALHIDDIRKVGDDWRITAKPQS
ncbi:MAG: bifunctional diaminohydroxyphosphoribosylaminopyrimidine deaminase/5-amino-6-(5-phosphoribosylamino)uracil reductase RibD [Halioglobus sp.]